MCKVHLLCSKTEKGTHVLTNNFVTCSEPYCNTTSYVLFIFDLQKKKEKKKTQSLYLDSSMHIYFKHRVFISALSKKHETIIVRTATMAEIAGAADERKWVIWPWATNFTFLPSYRHVRAHCTSVIFPRIIVMIWELDYTLAVPLSLLLSSCGALKLILCGPVRPFSFPGHQTLQFQSCISAFGCRLTAVKG